MKKRVIKAILVTSIAIIFSGCNETVVKGSSPKSVNRKASIKTIVLKKDQVIYWNGRVKYKAKKGDSLNITKIKPCKNNTSKTCYIVNHSKYGIGAVKKEAVE